jgi:iron-sulfur cluster assembly protein
VLISAKDEPYLNGLRMDWVRQGLNEGFEFLNPNSKGECGCGESFKI